MTESIGLMKSTGIPLCPLFPPNTHICFHYSTVSELLSVIVPFIKSGKNIKEKCIWFTIKKGIDTTNQSDILTYLKHENNIIPDGHIDFTLTGYLQDELLNELEKKVASIFQVQTENVRIIVYFKLSHNSIQETIQVEDIIHQISKNFNGLVMCVHNINKSHPYLIAKLSTLHTHTLIYYGGELKITGGNGQKISTNSGHTMEIHDLKDENYHKYSSISEKQLLMQFISATLSNNITQIIMKEDDPDRGYKAIGEMLEFTRSSFGFLGYLYNQEKMVLFTKSNSDATVGKKNRFELSINIWNMLCKIAENDNDQSNKQLLSRVVPHCPEITNYYIVSMRFKGECIAVFCTANKIDGYNQKDMDLISNIAQCITPVFHVIKEQWLREEERKKIEKYQIESIGRLKLLSQTANELLHSRNITKAIENVCKDLMEYFSFEKFLIFQHSDETDQLYLSHSFGLSEKINDDTWLQLGVSGFEQVSKTRELVFGDLSKEEHSKHFNLFFDQNVKIYVTIPLIGYNGKAFGCIIFTISKDLEINPHSQILLSIISNQMSVALERKKTASKFKEHRKELNRAQKVSMTGSWSMKNGMYCWSDEIYRIFSLPANVALLNDVFLSYTHPDDRVVVEKQWLGNKKKQINFAIRIIVNEKVKWIKITAEREYDHMGELVNCIGTIQDITRQKSNEIELQKYHEHLEQLIEERTEELRKSQEKLARSEKMEALGLLAGGIAHDFNNMIQVITGITHYTLKKEPLNDPLKSNLELISSTAWNAATLTQRLLAFSKKQILTPTVFSLDNLIVNLKPVISHLLGDEIALIYTIQKTNVSIEADQAGIEQVIMNILLYAKNAMPQGGTLFLELQKIMLDGSTQTVKDPLPDGAYAVVSITDTSCGINQDVLERIFEPFFTTGRFNNGTGLSLSSAYGTIQQSNGTIRVYSTPGVGTTFKIYLPVSLKEQVFTDKNITAESGAFQCNETILFVEDSQHSLEFISGELKDLGYRVLTASNGEEALKIAKKYSQPIHLLITDVLLPGMNGWELSVSLLKKIPSIKTLYISGYDHEEIIKKGKIRTEDGFLSKPFSCEQLAVKIREMLGPNSCNPPKDNHVVEVDKTDTKKRVLIVDDIPGVAHAFAVVLKNSNLEIRTAEDGKNTLETASHFKPDVVVLDLNLPDMDGEQVARELRKSSYCSDSFIIAASGYNIDELESDGLFDACLIKPIDIKRLEALIIEAPTIDQKRKSFIASQR